MSHFVQEISYSNDEIPDCRGFEWDIACLVGGYSPLGKKEWGGCIENEWKSKKRKRLAHSRIAPAASDLTTHT